MRGFGMIKIGQVGWLDHPVPQCGPLDAIIRPIAVAPCTSDVMVYHGFAGEHDDIIIGHEAVGIIEKTGELVTRFHPGDRVAVPCVTPDWLAPGVQNPRRVAHDAGEQASSKFGSAKDGVMAELFHVNHADANLAAIPESVTNEAALMATDMMATGLHGAAVAEVGFGDTVVVVGIGPVGLMAVAGAILRGAGRVIAVGTRAAAIPVALGYGASEVISYRNGTISTQVLALTDGLGADEVIVAGGDIVTLAEAVRAVRPGGIVSNINFQDERAVLRLPMLSWGLGMSDKDIRGSYCPGGGEMTAAMLRLIEHGRLDPTRMITHRFHGWDCLPEAFYLMDAKPADLIKPVVFL